MKLQILLKMKKKLQKLYLAYYSLFIALSNLVNSLSEGTYRIKCKFGHDDKKCEIYGIKYKYCDCFLEYANFKDDLMEYKYLCYNKNYQHKCDEKLSLFYHCKKVFVFMSIWVIGKNSMKHHYLKKMIL